MSLLGKFDLVNEKLAKISQKMLKQMAEYGDM